MLFIYVLMIFLLVRISSADFKTKRIPNVLNLSMFVLGYGTTLIDWDNWYLHLSGLILVPLVPFVLLIICQGRMIGAGDVKLLMGLGLVLKNDLGFKMLFLACIIGLVYWLLLFLLKKNNGNFAFGPCIASASVLVLFWK